MKTDSSLVQEKILTMLQKQIERKQIHHAYLFSGESQLEKKNYSRTFCRTLTIYWSKKSKGK